MSGGDVSPEPRDGFGHTLEEHERFHYECWLQEQMERDAIEAEKAEKAKKTEVGAKRKASEVDDALADEYTCPITHELPVEPCIAEDGHLYDQWALEKWMETQTDPKSPMTNKPMGKKLYPAVQARNAIHRLIDKGLIAGPGANKWKQKQKELEAMTATMRETVAKAFKGDVPSMRKFGFAYRDGLHGVKKDYRSAVGWFRLAARADDPMSLVSIGVFYLNGTGLPKDVATGMVYLTRAAMLGSEHACITLGNNFAAPRKGVVVLKDDEQAGYWYRKSLKATHRDSLPKPREVREKWLSEHGGANQQQAKEDGVREVEFSFVSD